MQLAIRNEGNSELDASIDTVMLDISDSLKNRVDTDSEEYTATVDNLVKLSQVRTDMAKAETGKSLDKNTIFTGLVAIGQVVLIMVYENRNVFASAAKQFIKRV